MKLKIEKIERVSSASVLKGTGKNWDQWVELLDKLGARQWTHQEIVAYLKKKHKLGPWWQQGVTRGFEIHIGRTIEGRNLKGEYSTAASRTFALNSKELWRFVTSSEAQNIWLKPLVPLKFKAKQTYEAEGGIFGEIRTMKLGERVRMSWQETDWMKPTILNVEIHPRQGRRSALVFQHDSIKDARVRLRMRSYWKEVIAELHALAKAKAGG